MSPKPPRLRNSEAIARAQIHGAAYTARILAEAKARYRSEGRTTVTVADVEHAAASDPASTAELREALGRHAETVAAAVESAGKHAARASELERRLELLCAEVESIRKNSSAVAKVLREQGQTERAEIHATYAGAMERLLARCEDFGSSLGQMVP